MTQASPSLLPDPLLDFAAVARELGIGKRAAEALCIAKGIVVEIRIPGAVRTVRRVRVSDLTRILPEPTRLDTDAPRAVVIDWRERIAERAGRRRR